MPKTFSEVIVAILGTPAAQFGVGLGVFYGVQKFFKEVEEKLSASSRIEIWMWLAGKHANDKVRTWPKVFIPAFDAVFGSRPLSWHFFFRSSAASAVFAFGFYLFPTPAFSFNHWYQFPLIFAFIAFLNCLPDYLSLIKTRYMLGKIAHTNSAILQICGVLLDLLATLYIAGIPAVILMLSEAGEWKTALSLRFYLLMPWIALTDTPQNRFVVFPSLFTTSWVFLYFISYFIVRVANFCDSGLALINRRLDVENKPLQSMGFVAAMFCMLVYWTAAILDWYQNHRIIG